MKLSYMAREDLLRSPKTDYQTFSYGRSTSRNENEEKIQATEVKGGTDPTRSAMRTGWKSLWKTEPAKEELRRIQHIKNKETHDRIMRRGLGRHGPIDRMDEQLMKMQGR